MFKKREILKFNKTLLSFLVKNMVVWRCGGSLAAHQTSEVRIRGLPQPYNRQPYGMSDPWLLCKSPSLLNDWLKLAFKHFEFNCIPCATATDERFLIYEYYIVQGFFHVIGHWTSYGLLPHEVVIN